MDNSFDINITSLPWPDGTKKLFRPGKPSPQVATVSPSWQRYALGYREAAEYLSQQVRETGLMTDLLVFPIIFLYRHYAELRLKELILAGNHLFDGSVCWNEKGEHSLHNLWMIARPYIERLSSQTDHADVNHTEALILELNQFDPRSTEARYPGSFRMPGGIEFMDMINFHEAMLQLSAFLDSASDMMNFYSGCKNCA